MIRRRVEDVLKPLKERVAFARRVSRVGVGAGSEKTIDAYCIGPLDGSKKCPIEGQLAVLMNKPDTWRG